MKVNRVNNMHNVFNHPQVAARQNAQQASHPFIGSMGLVNPGVIYNGQRMKTRLIPPVLGIHTKEILEDELGMHANEIQELRSKGVL